MKKIYIIPEIDVVLTSQSMPIAASGDLQYNEDGTITGGLNDDDATEDGLVKGSRNVGNVWDDDWSR
ncbi:MAG: hypothetical protein IJJ94_08820 [Bacteroidaceae bacterium]|nr:hypothetical protein [Bacteroidales bacterium]MBQ6434028.1 hypothetical protein [Bacteroidaceae bacterium]